MSLADLSIEKGNYCYIDEENLQVVVNMKIALYVYIFMEARVRCSLQQ